MDKRQTGINQLVKAAEKEAFDAAVAAERIPSLLEDRAVLNAVVEFNDIVRELLAELNQDIPEIHQIATPEGEHLSVIVDSVLDLHEHLHLCLQNFDAALMDSIEQQLEILEHLSIDLQEILEGSQVQAEETRAALQANQDATDRLEEVHQQLTKHSDAVVERLKGLDPAILARLKSGLRS